MTDPVVAQSFPYFTEVEAGETYKWCACGQSASQPFCDGSHKGSDFKPVEYTAEATKKIAFCGCKQSKRGAVCDGTHNSL